MLATLFMIFVFGPVNYIIMLIGDLRWNHAQALPCSNAASMDFIGIPVVVAPDGNIDLVIQRTS